MFIIKWGLLECLFGEGLFFRVHVCNKIGVVRMFIINLGLFECLFGKGVHACYKIGVVRMFIGKLGFVRDFSFKWGYVQCVIKL